MTAVILLVESILAYAKYTKKGNIVSPSPTHGLLSRFESAPLLLSL
jgi:hypothetical protein